ncbi:hypothetical protein IHC92_18330 [Photobacterium damselae subsp. damselae]|uniref:hypothetical protein n=1 Tax=Photobacterium damselae TaxID=38293 RepID=UPI001F390C3A|nr:hypothetical protein [Photobacterium damselae]UJZ95415.1 hypothetical protein IHC87_18345 [Photobacterium damselae subsp. damselae]UJZ99570.1 hypothetical protein IHC88_19145 [Photobacterium damselae subsp. damselae]UKA08678.1 hypothetical protein IHC90_16855 [Photobacterium damselae subsp. damselae]UKA11739.1 hypothetical protein IHC91_18320 [Photobacterium damselae subsp. damselae]UKA22928.1 hypothetical protein IHC92_18330 [Photobacterium damselae subsp. damselae]
MRSMNVPTLALSDAENIINVVARVTAKRRGMSISTVKSLLMLGTEPTYENSVLFARQQTPKSLEDV